MKDSTIVLVLAILGLAGFICYVSPTVFGATLVLLLCLAVYLLPWIVAVLREHHDTGAIFVLNFALGWTLLGWLWALIWAFMNPALDSRQARPAPMPATWHRRHRPKAAGR